MQKILAVVPILSQLKPVHTVQNCSLRHILMLFLHHQLGVPRVSVFHVSPLSRRGFSCHPSEFNCCAVIYRSIQEPIGLWSY